MQHCWLTTTDEGRGVSLRVLIDDLVLCFMLLLRQATLTVVFVVHRGHRRAYSSYEK